MTHIVSGKIRKAPYTKDGCGQDGQSKMYVFDLSEKVKDFKTQQDSFTNYSAMFFAKTPGAKQFYDQAFQEGAFVVVACEKLKVNQREHEGKTYITLSMENARLEGASYPESTPQQGGYANQQNNSYQQPQNNQPNRMNQPPQNNYQGQTNTPPDFDDD